MKKFIYYINKKQYKWLKLINNMNNTDLKKKAFFKNFSTSASESLLNIFSGNIKAEEFLTKAYIIRNIKIGFSYLSENNKPNILNQLFKGEMLHASIYLGVESKESKTGILVQYGKYEIIKKDNIKKEFHGNIKNIGFPYENKGGLMFAEIEFKKFKEIFCTAGVIYPRINKKTVQMTVNNFFERIKSIDKPWTLENYNPHGKNCQDFVVAAIKIINPIYSPEEDKDDDLTDENIPIVINEELKNHIN